MISFRFIKSSLLYTLAGTLPAASAILLLPFYIQFLSVELYAVLSLYLAASLICQILITSSFDVSVYITYQELREDSKKLSQYLSSVYAWVLIVGVLLISMSAIFGPMLFKAFVKIDNTSFFPYGFLAVATALFQSVFKVHTSLLQAKQKPGSFFWSNLISFSLIAGFTMVGLWWSPNSLLGPIGGRFLAALLSTAWAFTGIIREHGWSVWFPSLRSSQSFNVPTLVYQVQQWMINYLDRPILFFFISLQSLGVYDFAFKCLLLIDFIMSGLHNSFYPQVVQQVMAQSVKKSTPEINRYYHGLTAAVLILVIGAILFFSLLDELGIVRKGYEGAFVLIPSLAVLYLIKSVRLYFNFPYGALKYARPLPWYYLVVSVIKLGLIVLLVPRFDWRGIVLASAASSVVEIGLLRYGLKGRFVFQFNYLKMVVLPFVVAILIALSEWLWVGEKLWLYVLLTVVTAALLLWAYRNELRQFKLT